jgi:hypothetical protein
VELGLERLVAERVIARGEELRKATHLDGIERGATIDAADGADFGEPAILVGTRSSVPLGQHLRNLRSGGRYISLHTHPQSHSFSEDDVVVMLSFPLVQIMTVIGGDGTWYIMERGANPPTGLDPRAAALAFRAALRDLLPEYRAYALSGEMAPEQAERALRSAAWELAAHDLDVRYAEVKSNDGENEDSDNVQEQTNR